MPSAKESIQEMINANFQSRVQIRAALETMGVESKVLQRVAPLDDNVDPERPQNIVVTSYLKALGIEWDAPPQKDAVAEVDIEVTPTGESSYIKNIKEPILSYVFNDLEYKQHSFRVRFRDKFGRVSTWSTTGVGAPSRSAQYEIDLTEAKILGTLKGLLPNENLDTIEDATKLGQGVVLAEAMAVQDAAAMNLWVGNGAIQNAMIGNAVVDTAKIANLAVTTAKIADLAVTNAKINSIVANKIVTSTLTATTITLGTGGKVQSAGGGMILSDSGLQLDYETVLGLPSENIERKVTAKGLWGSLSFYSQSSPNTRGVFLRSDGEPGAAKAGGVYIMATPNGSNTATATASIDVNSLSSGGINLTANNITLNGDTDVIWNRPFRLGLMWTPITISGNGSFLDFTHNLGSVPQWIMWQYREGSQTDWRNLVDATSGLTCHFDNDSGRITNNKSVSILVRGFIAK